MVYFIPGHSVDEPGFDSCLLLLHLFLTYIHYLSRNFIIFSSTCHNQVFIRHPLCLVSFTSIFHCIAFTSIRRLIQTSFCHCSVYKHISGNLCIKSSSCQLLPYIYATRSFAFLFYHICSVTSKHYFCSPSICSNFHLRFAFFHLLSPH